VNLAINRESENQGTITMTYTHHHQVEVAIQRNGRLRRRDFVKTISAGTAAAGALTWTDVMNVQAEELRRRGMACILLWMQGGPSQFETFAPKSGSTGGETKAISTSVSGIQVSENLPRVAEVMDDVCVIRSMTSKEGSHPRATYLLQTGYLPTASVKFPSLGANIAKQIGDPSSDLPSYVRIGNRFRGGADGGLLGVQFDPFVVSNATRPPDNTQVASGKARYLRRLKLLGNLEAGYEKNGGKQEVADHRKLYEKTSRMVLSPQMDAFDLQQESRSMRERYGSSQFASGCLMARRLIESGVTFVEVNQGGWDTHFNNFDQVKQRCEQIDQPFAYLLRDLKKRGMLDKTLVVWMGEFGRTPRINPRSGRDHYPRAFSVAMAGCGVKGGQVIGETDASGASVTEHPVTVSDLFRTICSGLKVDADHENMSSIGRPIKIVENGKVVKKVFA